MPRKIEGAIRTDTFRFFPEDLTIKGYDDDDTAHHLCDRESNAYKITPEEVANVREYGVIEPIVLSMEGGEKIVAAGRRRCRWARAVNEALVKAGAERIMVEVTIRKDAPERLRGVMLAENAIRTVSDPLHEANRVAELYNVNKWSVEKIATTLGKKVATIKSLLNVSMADDDVKAAVLDNTIPLTGAADIAKLPVAEQRETVARVRAQAAANPKKNAKASKARPAVSVRAIRKATAKSDDVRDAPTKREVRERLETAPESVPTETLRALKWTLGLVKEPW